MKFILANRTSKLAAIALLFQLHFFNFQPLHAAPYDKVAEKIILSCMTQKIKKIAVMSFPYVDKRPSGGSNIVSERLTTLIVQKTGVQVVERALLDKVIEELKLGQTGMVDANTAYQLGKVLDVDAILTGTLIDLPDRKVEINARLINVINGEILGVANGKVAKEWYDDVTTNLASNIPPPAAPVQETIPLTPPALSAKTEFQEWELIGLSSREIRSPASKKQIKERYKSLLASLRDKKVDHALSEAQWVYLNSYPKFPFYTASSMVCYGEALELIGRTDEAKRIYTHVMTKYPFEKGPRQKAATKYSVLAR